MKDKKSILVVEDTQGVRDFLCVQLESDGFAVSACEDGISALNAAEGNNFDVIITDYRMPNMNGAEVTKHLRTRFPASLIIGISIDNMKDVFLDAGADAFLNKPFQYDDLAALMKTKQ